MKKNGNKYCYIQFKIDEKVLNPVIIELFYNDCPKTSENFLSICKGTKNSKGELLTYEETSLNRIVKNGYVQCGDLKDLNKNLCKFIIVVVV